MGTLITLNPIDPGTDTRVTVRVCATQDPADTGANGEVWWPAITAQPAISARLFDGDFTSGVDSGSASAELRLDVLVRSGAFPRIERYDWAGATATIQRRTSAGIQTLAVMKVESFASEQMRLALRFSASTDLFDVNVLSATYAGTTGIEGGDNIKGQPKPWIFGRALNVEPVFIDQIDNVFQVSGYGPVQAISAVYERGASFGLSVGDFANYAALVAATIPPGRWGTCLAQGLFRLGAPPAGVITCDVNGDNANGFIRRTGAILQEIAGRRGLSGSVNSTSLTALDSAVARNVNIVISDQISFMELVQRMVAPCNAVPGIGSDGRLLVSRVVFGTEALRLDAQGREMPPVTGMARQNTSAPYKRIQMGAARSWRVHSFDEVAFYSDLIDRGLYDADTFYREGNVVARIDKSRWLYINPTPSSGNAPPFWPLLENDHWANIEPPASEDPNVANDRVVLQGSLADRPTGGEFWGQVYVVIDPENPGAQPSEMYRWDGPTAGWVLIATEGAVVPRPGSGVPGNIRDDLGRRYDPGELLNTSIALTPSGELVYRPLPEIPAISLGFISLPDLGAASTAALRRAEDDIDQVSRALAVALDEASRTRQTFTDAGFYADPATGQIRIHAIEQTREQVSLAEIRLNAAEARINLSASVNYVNEQIALAVLDPSQIADLEEIFVRITEAEVDIDGLNAAVSLLASATEMSLLAGRVTTAESAIDALEGTITTKVDTTTFDALASRVTTAESTLTAIGDVAQIVNTVRSVRLVERDQDANAEADLRALLQGDRQQREQVAAIASARQELTARIISGDEVEAAARLALQVRVGQVEATAATETIARISGDNALALQITALTASTNTSAAALNAAITAEIAARTDADTALATSITGLSASITNTNSNLAAEQQARINAINAEAAARVAAIQAEATARGTALTAEQQARIDAINAEATARANAIAAEATARQQAVTTLTASITAADQARVDGDNALAASITNLTASLTTTNANVAAEQQARIAAINAEADARVAAINAEAQARGQALTSEQQARIAAINAERQQTLADVQAEAQARQQAITSLAASVQTEQQARIDGDALIAAGLSQQVTVGRVTDGEAAALAEELLGALLTGDKTRRETNGAIAGARQEITAQIVADKEAFASSLTALVARIAGNEASIVAESQARATAIESVAQSVTSLNASFTTQLSTETTDRIAAVAAEAQARGTEIGQVSNNLGTAIITERDARIAAIQAEAAARGTALTAEEQARIDAINAEATARQAAIAAEQQARQQAVTTLTASIQSEATARADADGALASQITNLNASFTTAITTEQTTRANAITAEAQARIAAIQAEAQARGTALTAEENARIAAIQAETAARTQAITDEQAARQQAVTSLTASIQSEATARANADGALANSITTLTTTVNGNSASIATFAESINGLQARAGVRLDVNGRVTGWVLNNNGSQGSMDVVVDSFRIFASGMSVAQAPFEFSGGNLRLSGNVRVGGSAIIDGSLTAGALVANGVTRTYFGQNSTSFSLVPDVVDNLVSITIEMERPGTIILMGSFIFTYASGSWSANIAVDGATLQSGTSDNDRYASFNGAFFAATAGTYVARMRASGNACAVNAGGATLTVLRTYT